MNLLIIGCGNMGGAMLRGWLAGGRAPETFTVVDPVLADPPAGVRLVRDIAVLAGERFDHVLLGFKPQQLADSAPAVGGAVTGATVLSLLAGVDLATLGAAFPTAGAVVLVMPNLAAAIGRSPIALAAEGLDEPGRAGVAELMAPLGAPEWVGEDRFDLVTALAGSGPGFVYRIIAAFADGAAELGLPRDQAARLALAMVDGAAALAAASPDDPATLARKVASPGGTTQAGLDVLDADGRLLALVRDTLRAARDRSAEMREESRRG